MSVYPGVVSVSVPGDVISLSHSCMDLHGPPKKGANMDPGPPQDPPAPPGLRASKTNVLIMFAAADRCFH